MGSQDFTQSPQKYRFIDKRYLLLFFLYSSQGIPIYFFTLALPIILRKLNYPIDTISSLGLLALPWALKFFWAPLIDRYGNPEKGKRKSWILPLQFFIAVAFLLLAFVNPEQSTLNASGLFLFSFFLVIVSATQDTAIDALMIDCLAEKERPTGNAIQAFGGAFGVILGGTIGVLAYEAWGWEATLGLYSLLSLCCFFLLQSFREDSSFGSQLLQENSPNTSYSLYRDFTQKFKDFISRPRTKNFLFFLLLYRAGEACLMGVQGPFLIDQKFSPSFVGTSLGLWGAGLGMGASFLAGYFLKKFSPTKLLLKIAYGKMAIYFCMSYLCSSFMPAKFFANEFCLGLILIHSFLRYMILVSFYTLFMKFCEKKQLATDFSLLVSCDLLFYIFLVSLAGKIVLWSDYSVLFGLAFVLTLVGILLFPSFIKGFSLKDESGGQQDQNELVTEF